MNDLHAAIMNLPCTMPPGFENSFERECYRLGHRDARHAAAELALAASPLPQEDARDAARHRWLRDKSGADIRSLLGVGDLTSLDAHIDAAIAGTQGEQKP